MNNKTLDLHGGGGERGTTLRRVSGKAAATGLPTAALLGVESQGNVTSCGNLPDATRQGRLVFLWRAVARRDERWPVTAARAWGLLRPCAANGVNSYR